MFADRADAGRRLAVKLSGLRSRDVVVLGLPRGGVPVAFQVAQSLQAPLDVIVVRKLGVPFQPELAMGAIGEGGVRVVNQSVVDAAGVTSQQFAAVEQSERRELSRRVARFRGGRAPVPLDGKTAVVVDDGIATGSTARAACQVARALGAARVVLATPVAPPDTVAELHRYADQVVCLHTPRFFRSIGEFYADFTQTTDSEVNALLARASRPDAATGRSADSPRLRWPIKGCDPPARDDELEVAAGTTLLPGRLTVPAHTRGMVIFAHGSGSSRHSPRNRFVADQLARAGLGTLLIDLLSPRKSRTGRTCSTSSCWPSGWSPPPCGCGRRRTRRTLASATSVPAPGPRRRFGRRLTQPRKSPRLSRAAGAPTLPSRVSRRCAPRPCSSSAGGTRSCSS